MRKILDIEATETGAEHFYQLFLTNVLEQTDPPELEPVQPRQKAETGAGESARLEEEGTAGFRLFSQTYKLSFEKKGAIYRKLDERIKYKRDRMIKTGQGKDKAMPQGK